MIASKKILRKSILLHLLAIKSSESNRKNMLKMCIKANVASLKSNFANRLIKYLQEKLARLRESSYVQPKCENDHSIHILQ